MKVRLGFVPPGGGETDYSLEFDLPALPRTGDYISIQRGGKTGAETFVVRRSWWNLTVDANGSNGALSELWIECEFAEWGLSSEDHKNAVGRYEQRTGKKITFDESMY
jgi:hypothetical protein